MAVVICAECGKQEEYDMKPGYPRKYCRECSQKRTAEFQAKKQGTVNSEIAHAQEVIKSVMQPKQPSFMDDRSMSIVAQVITKGAVEMTSKVIDKETTREEISENLAMCVDELTATYKLALLNLSK